ncbi:MAG: glutamate--tRNA ligase [Candidatus Dadabacteria bacterium]|nr:glutamate--tRNA ligase [Candidatus Dadabacteria bacterium]NIQ14251.1 glutamate--tRNA ligase [Candidatus Dadabacteria bacterium]
MKIRTRFAPSPTGVLHIGGARTAIFNWLFSRNKDGEFVLRIEDTDKVRSTKESETEILESMKWLGLDWDGPPIRQSERIEIYQELANKLLNEGKAYKCFVTSEELQQKRNEAQSKGEFFRYKREWADLGSGPDKPYAIRLATEQQGSVEVFDLLRGKIRFDLSEIDDFIILKADGFPTYNFAVAVDDSDMKISHVIRGDDHLTNTSKQILIYDALDLVKPHFAHVSMILGVDKSKLSKRHGAASVIEYKNIGYLSEAVLNYLVRLGWSYGDQEIFSRDELIEKFNLSNIGKSPSIFDPDKFRWVNSWYIKNKPASEIAEKVAPFLLDKGYNIEAKDALIVKVVEQLRERSDTLNDIVDQSDYFFNDDYDFESKAKNKFLVNENIEVFQKIVEKLTTLDEFDHDSLSEKFSEIMEETGLKLGKIAQPTRVALTGGTKSPGIFEVIEILGKEKTLKRLNKAIDICSAQKE